ncbi:MAG: PSD1 and planctomycete cytochrome C domain-containing protein [Planctomycetaceae bacterium]
MRLAFIKCWMLLFAVHAVAQDGPRYSSEIRPILAKNCFVCHGADEASREANLRLDVPPGASADSNAIVPGDPDGSDLVKRITSSDPEQQMPPPDSGHTLSDEQIAVLSRWIAAGATYESHWSFLPPVRPDVPTADSNDWCRTDVDRFVYRKLMQQHLTPSAQADPYTLIRRVALDLTGLPPEPGAADQFAADPSDAAYVAIVDDLLASPRFGEHWAAMWLDLARYADTKGYEKDLPRDIWRYRDWVIDAFNRDLPYDQFTIEQIAGDLLLNATSDQLLATAFHRNTMTNDEGGTDNEEFRIAAVKDRVDTTMQVWMGLTMGCAKCHSHKYDPITQQEYYSFLSFFNQTQDADRNDDSPRVPTPTFEQQRRIDEAAERLAALKAQSSSDSSDAVARNIKAAEEHLAALQKEVVSTPVMSELPADRRRRTHVHVRGNFLEPGAEVAPGFPEAFSTAAELSSVNRLDVARWLMDDSNPLTGRVAVNRVWARLFGRGLVETEEDFGTQGQTPTHPELLDWLAVEFRDTHNWSFKQLCRSLVLSATYRQSAVVTPTALQQDADNRWLSRGPRFRLSAETVRDQALMAAGLLSDRIGGPSVMPPQPDGFWRTTYSKLKWETSVGEDRYRRALYTFLRRTSPYPSLMTFDATSREVCQIRRVRTNTPLQALIAMNDPVYVEAAGALAAAVRGTSLTSEDRARQMFRRVLIRQATAPEVQRLRLLFDETYASFAADPAAAAELLKAANQSVTPEAETGEILEAAAWTVVATVVLNLDEAVTKP